MAIAEILFGVSGVSCPAALRARCGRRAAFNCRHFAGPAYYKLPRANTEPTTAIAAIELPLDIIGLHCWLLERTVARQPELLGIIGFQMNGHVYPWVDGYGVDV